MYLDVRRRRRYRQTLHLLAGKLLLAAGAWLSATGALAAGPLELHVVPQFPLQEIHRSWVPLAEAISKLAGVSLELKVATSIPEFERQFLAGTPDIAYLNPYHAVMAKRARGYEPIICDASQSLSGVLVVRADSRFRSLTDLQGQEIVFPSPNAFGAALYLRALLGQKEGIVFSARYAVTHSNVYRRVLSGTAAAGGGIRNTLNREPDEVRSGLRVLYETPPANPHPVVVHPRVAAQTRARLQRAFLDLAQTPQGASLLKEVGLVSPRAASYRDYAPLERLGLEKFADHTRAD